jgi:general secretion pathway protein M
MTVREAVERVLNYSPLVAASIYGIVVIALVATTWLALAGIYSGESALAETASLLERLQGRKAAPAAGGGAMTGSPFLEGPSVTVAGAALLQRVAGAVTKAGGTVQSSQVDVAGSQGGMVKLQLSCEIAQPDLQRLLYDLEAGMPFLFVDELTAEMPQAAAGANDASSRMHVQLAVSGEWQGAVR